MSAKKSHRKLSSPLHLIWICFLGCLLLVACGGSSGGGGGEEETDPSPTNEPEWHKSVIGDVSSDGISARVVTTPEGADTVHIAYFDNSGDAEFYGGIQYARIQLSGNDATIVDSSADLTTIDNNATLSMALDNIGKPLVAYRGGGDSSFCQAEQSDVMVSMPGTTDWDEYTAAVGINHRQAVEVLRNGMSGTESDLVIDSDNNVHIVYTFRYEGCETVNHTFPDLRYIRLDAANPQSDVDIEEFVHRNDWPEFNVVVENNSVGHFCDIVLDGDEQPIAFYAEKKVATEGAKGLHMAYKTGEPSAWVYEWVEELDDEEEIVAVSGAVSPVDGAIGVAYAVELDDGDRKYKYLKYAYRDDAGMWHRTIVDESASVGTHCSLSFSDDGDPIIAYYAEKAHTGRDLENLRLTTWMEDSGWERETVASAGLVGKYNSLWVDSEGAPHIVTYNDTTNEILHYVKR